MPSVSQDLSCLVISEIMDICFLTDNKHLWWFKRLLDNHFEGIIATHATYTISAGKIEGINKRKLSEDRDTAMPMTITSSLSSLIQVGKSMSEILNQIKSHKVCD